MKVVVVGSGLAGLLVAIEASENVADAEVTLVTKGSLGESNSAWAQGGVAVVGPQPDTVVSHVTDTRRAGAGLSDPAAAMALAADGPTAIDRLLELGVTFDRENGALCRALEAAHSHPRVLRAGGDATGAEIVRALAVGLNDRPVTVLEHTHAIDVELSGGVAPVVTGLLVRTAAGDVERIDADAVVLATGGAGQLYATTTNPAVATADGVAIALRAGAEVADLEMVQFHPTVLAGEHPFLVSEAVRGEGAVLLDDAGRRFMTEVHPDAELAPRDVVARAIAEQEARQGSPVMLDATALGAAEIAQRFPTIVAACAERGLDITTQSVPVTPAAHYWMGGVRTDLAGRTSVPGLWAAGEVACTGVHGANRLASNSLLEAAVFARRTVASLAEAAVAGPRAAAPSEGAWTAAASLDLEDGPGAADWDRAQLQDLLWEYAGLMRDAEGLARAAHVLAGFVTPSLLPDAMFGLEARDVEDANLLLAARALVAAAAARTDSLGAHTRRDSLPAGSDLVADTRHHVLVAPVRFGVGQDFSDAELV